MQNSLRSLRAGFGLVEALIVCAVLSLIALGLEQLMESSAKGQANVQYSVSFQTVISSASTILNDYTACSQALQGTAMNPAATSPQPVTKLSFGGNTVIDTTPANQPSSGLRIKDFQFVPSPAPIQVQPNTWSTTLTLDAEKLFPGQPAGQGQKLQWSFPLTVVLNGSNQIVSCFGANSNAQMCVDVGGTYSDSTTPRCIMPTPLPTPTATAPPPVCANPAAPCGPSPGCGTHGVWQRWYCDPNSGGDGTCMCACMSPC